MTTPRALFEHLLAQINIQDGDIVSQLSEVSIAKVDVLAKSHTWRFYLNAPKRIHPHVYEVFHYHLRDAFVDIAHVEVWWQFENATLSEEEILNYWYSILSRIALDSPYVKSALSQASYQLC